MAFEPLTVHQSTKKMLVKIKTRDKLKSYDAVIVQLFKKAGERHEKNERIE
jgi:hypothetical protein